jgi:nucleoside-diphosphate-sugar epimerase
MSDSAFSGQQVAVTGGAGFIGSHLVDALLRHGAQVRVIDNFTTGRYSNLEHLQAEIELVEGDIRSQDDLRKVCRNSRWIFHQAALGSVPRSMRDPATTYEVNLVGTVRVLQAAVEAGAERVVYASSSSVYGNSEALPKKEGEEGEPLSPYAASKLACEQAASQFLNAFGIEVVGLRYFNVYGAHQDPDGPYAAVVPRFFQRFLREEAPVIYGDGEQSRDFTFVGDAVRANLLAATAAEASGQVINVARGKSASVGHLASLVRELVGASVEPKHESPRPGDVRHSLADLEQARSILGFEAMTDLHSGLKECLTYYRRKEMP